MDHLHAHHPFREITLRGVAAEGGHRSPARAARKKPDTPVGLLTLMSDKTNTEMQFARLLGSTLHYVELVLAVPQSYRSGHDLTGLYERWGETSLPRRLDGLIVTGAPLEHLSFEDVSYWRELSYICNWATSNVGRTLYICWAAFAALYIFYGAHKRVRPHKISGVFQQQVMDARHPLTAGMETTFPCPVSRCAEVLIHDLPWRRGLKCLAQSLESGLSLVADAAHNAHYMFNHLEYDAEALVLSRLRTSSGYNTSY
jgi:homoserine O-succinyltransferase/O-acetyltransferase